MLPVNILGPNFNDETKKQLPCMTEKIKKSILNSSVLTISEKIELILIFLNIKWATELGTRKSTSYIEREKEYAPLLNQIGLPYGKNYLVRRGKRIEWIQVAANGNILDFIIRRRNFLTTFEAGGIYGYPTTHILAFLGLINKAKKQNKETVADHYLAGCFSEAYKKNEQEYFADCWKKLKKCCPQLIEEAENEYLKRRQSES